MKKLTGKLSFNARVNLSNSNLSNSKFLWKNFQKCSTLYFASKVVCFARKKKKRLTKNSLVFYNALKNPYGTRTFAQPFCFIKFIVFYFNIALILLTPLDELSSFLITKVPSSAVFLTCGPPQICLSTPSIVYTETIWSSLSAVNTPYAPFATASQYFSSVFTTSIFFAITSFTKF